MKDDNPLLFLVIVDEYLTNPDLPLTSHSREFALSNILAEQISLEYNRLCKIHYGYAVKQPASKPEALSIIETDVKHHSYELMAWAWLHYFYIQVDFAITSQEFCKIAHIDERTLRRLKKRAVKILTNKLIHLEWNARIEHRKRQLSLSLPHLGNVRLFGRDREFENVLHYLMTSSPCHMQVVGAAGVGKTAFTEVTVKHLIDNNEVYRVIWINYPQNLDHIYHYILDCLQPHNPTFSLREYFVLSKTVIILDDLSTWSQPTELDTLLEELEPAVVIILNRDYIPLRKTHPVLLRELDQIDAEALVRHQIATFNGFSPGFQEDVFVSELWNRVGGNPFFIELALSSASFLFEKQLDFSDVASALMSNLGTQLGEDAISVWIVLTLLPVANYKMDELLSVLPDRMDSTCVTQLVQAHLIETSAIDEYLTYRLINSARAYIEHMPDHSPPFASILNRLLASFWDKSGDDYLMITIVENILLNGWEIFSTQSRVDWVRHWSKFGIKRGHWATWQLLLAPFINTFDNLRNELYYAICLRHLGDWNTSQSILSSVVLVCGEKGQFIEQAEALVELSIIARHMGNYQHSLSLLSRAEQMANRYVLLDLVVTIRLIQCEIAIELQDYPAIRRTMADLPQTPEGILIKAEAHLTLGEIETSRNLLKETLGLPSNSASNPRYHSIMGRGWIAQGNFVEAHKHLSLAMLILEKTHDLFAIARSYSNLGGLLLTMKQNQEAEVLLKNAENIQRTLKDTIGLSTTRHNLTLMMSSYS